MAMIHIIAVLNELQYPLRIFYHIPIHTISQRNASNNVHIHSYTNIYGVRFRKHNAIIDKLCSGGKHIKPMRYGVALLW